MSIRFLLLGFALFSSSAGAQTENTIRLAEGETGQPASIDDIAFLTGHWRGDGMGGYNEELWGHPLGGSMLGLFRHLSDDEPAFSEIMQIAEEDGTLALRLKHFNPDLTGWEEKDDMVTFPLVRIDEGEAAFFQGLTYRLVSENELTIYLALRSEEGVREVVFELHRVTE